MTVIELRQKIEQKLVALTLDELVLVDQLLVNLESSVEPQPDNADIPGNHDPLALLRDSDFIGCFADATDLAEKSEEIIHEILAQQYSV